MNSNKIWCIALSKKTELKVTSAIPQLTASTGTLLYFIADLRNSANRTTLGKLKKMLFKLPTPIRLSIWCAEANGVYMILSKDVAAPDIWIYIAIIIFCTIFSLHAVAINPHGMQSGFSLPLDRHIRWNLGKFMPWEQAVISTGRAGPFFSICAGFEYINLISTSKYKRAIGLIIHYSCGKSKWEYGIDRIVSKYPVRDGDIEI